MKYVSLALAVFLLGCESTSSPEVAVASVATPLLPPPPPCKRSIDRPTTLHCTRWEGYHESCSDWLIGYENVCVEWLPRPTDAGVSP